MSCVTLTYIFYRTLSHYTQVDSYPTTAYYTEFYDIMPYPIMLSHRTVPYFVSLRIISKNTVVVYDREYLYMFQYCSRVLFTCMLRKWLCCGACWSRSDTGLMNGGWHTFVLYNTDQDGWNRWNPADGSGAPAAAASCQALARWNHPTQVPLSLFSREIVNY